MHISRPLCAHTKSADAEPDPSSAYHRHLEVELWDTWPAEYQSCTEATIGFVAIFAQFFSFLILTSSSRTCSCIQKVSHIFAFTLPSCIHMIEHRIFRFSSIQCRPNLNRRFRFRSVIPNLCHRISYGMLHCDKYEFARLAHWLENWPIVSLLQSKPTCLGPTNLHPVAPISFRIKLRLPSDQISVASCSLRIGFHH